MSTEAFQQIEEHLRQPAVVPVFRELLADLDTPVSAFLKVCSTADSEHAFLLESVEGGERWARYSFIGLDPYRVVRARNHSCEIQNSDGSTSQEHREDPLSLLQEELSRQTWLGPSTLPRFAGGAVGWLGWDAVRWWEPLAAPRPTPDCWTLHFMVPRSLLVFDNLRQRILAVRLVFCEQVENAEQAYQEAQATLDELEKRLLSPLSHVPHSASSPPTVTPRFERSRFEESVEKIQELIRAGDCIQVVLSQRFDLGYEGNPIDLYRALRAVSPSPYMFLVRTPEQTVIGASPEVMVRVQDRVAEVSPIAGTRRRGVSSEEDSVLAADLLADPKERAEHIMLVDLARNDLGKVGKPGSVEVNNLMHVEQFSHVMHMVSDVQAQLSSDKKPMDAVRSTFPAGTLSGAPKVRAMQIIDELEPGPREIYGGAVGWLGFDGNLDLAIAIRTAWQNAGGWKLQVGAGIVADSNPAAEYQETLDKAGALLKALKIAGRGL
ncbi:MAG: anthranilate synthase component I family protein [Myxococcota bacterium]|nr:anthranilate synthase component I family protein [Myxococcota bacterium]